MGSHLCEKRMSIRSTELGDHEIAGSARGIAKAKAPPTPIVTPRYATIPDWITISGMRRTGVYEALGQGSLRAVKLNGRTLIDVSHGLAWLATLPVAQITTAKRRPSSRSAIL
jgi:hypothetical protein